MTGKPQLSILRLDGVPGRWLRTVILGVVVCLAGAGCDRTSPLESEPASSGVPEPVEKSVAKPETEPKDISKANVARNRLKLIDKVERQPFFSQVRRLIEAMQFFGSPFSDVDIAALKIAMKSNDDRAVVEVQTILNRYTLIDVQINPEARVKLERGESESTLQQQGWRTFLVRVHNESRTTARLKVESDSTLDFNDRGLTTPANVRDRWLKVKMADGKPLNPRLSGLSLEYRIVTIYSRDAGDREGHIAFNVGQGTQDIGFRNDLHILFDCKPAVKVVLNIRDWDGTPTTCSLIIHDEKGQLYPLPVRRVEPDFFFQEQIYRVDGESLLLPPGRYDVQYSRGPEYLREVMSLDVKDAKAQTLTIKLSRWTNPEARGWISGDHHIHASGCSHYQSSEVGVSAESMMRHIEGEGLNIGNVLSWGPGWNYQKKNFSGSEDEVSTDRNVIRYDVEVSQFPSDHTGHLCLLRLREDDYPGTTTKDEWPSWGLPILQWAKSQDSVTGVAHSGWGLDVSPEKRVPNYVVPPMNNIGAQEFIVHVAHNAVDFISTVDTPYVWELNMWYHLLNCGFSVKASGETDFPCIYDERVGLGRSYVKFDNPGKVNYEDWIRGIQAGRSYVSDGYSHLQDFQVNGITPGGAENSILHIDAPQTVDITATVSAWLDETPRTVVSGAKNWDTAAQGAFLENEREEIPIRDLKYTAKPYWHIERARIGNTRTVSVELVVNGRPVAQREIVADGSETQLEFKVNVERSSWVALRILAASHTNPVTIQMGGVPVRASKLSAEWCLDGIDQVWLEKVRNIRMEERAEAYDAYDVARDIFREIRNESYDDTRMLTGADLVKRDSQHREIKERMKVMHFAMTRNDGMIGVITFDRTVRGFAGELDLKLGVIPEAATIHYTLDGSRPTSDSPIHYDTIKLNRSTLVSALGFMDGQPCTLLSTAQFVQYTLEDFGEDVHPGNTRPGLNYRYYQGEWLKYGDVTESALLTEHTVSNFTLNVRERDNFYALSFRGFINIPEDGIYTFGTTSNDGSNLYINDNLVVNNDGLHALRTITGDAPLKAGLHPIRVDYFNAGGGWGLDITWQGPDFDQQAVPVTVLSHLSKGNN